MSFCFGFISNDAALTHCALGPFERALTLEEGAPNGWGLACYQVGQPLLRKQPKPFPGPMDFTEMAANLRSNLVLGHIRCPTVGGQRTENTHPFRFRNWTFCHVGTVSNFDAVKESLLRALPDHIKRNIRGKTDSEHIFHLFLSFINDTGKLDDPRVPPVEAGKSLLATYSYLGRMLDEAAGGGDAPNIGSCMVSNGQFILAARHGEPLSIRRQGAYSCPDETGRTVERPHLKTVVLVAGETPAGPGWETVEDGTVVAVDTRLEIQSVAAE